jgi:hypothetical protein
MRTHTHFQKLSAAAMSMLLLAPSFGAVQATPWNYMTNQFVDGTITVTTKAGKNIKRHDRAVFSPTALSFQSSGDMVERSDVSEVTVRGARTGLSDGLDVGLEGLAFFAYAWSDSSGTAKIPLIILGVPYCVVVTAVVLPAGLIIGGINQLKPAPVIYRVVP